MKVETSYTRAGWALAALLLVKAFVILLVIIYGNIGLGPDEAQYWTWSQEPALGYYSKPPGIAWQIWASTKLFGSTELGVRFGAVVVGTLIPAILFFLAKSCALSSRASFYTAAGFALCPLGAMASFLAITDGGQVLFWTVALLLIASSFSRSRSPPYLTLGLAILGGALFKWPMYLFWLFASALLFSAKNRAIDRFGPLRFLGGLALSLLALLPSLIWNSQHNWVTFRHVRATVAKVGLETAAKETGNFFSFLGGQIILVSPLLFALFLVAIWLLLRDAWRHATAIIPGSKAAGKPLISPAVLFCGSSSVLIFLSYLFFSSIKKIQGNWCDFAYPGAFLLTIWMAWDFLKKGKRWVTAGIAVAAFLSALSFSLPALLENNLLSLPYSINPYRHNVGWKALSRELKKNGYDPAYHFLFADKYQMSSILSFYAEGQKRAYFFNIHGLRKNQFSFWPSMKEEQLGKTGFFVVAENIPTLNRVKDTLPEVYKERLSPYFEHVEYLGLHELFQSGGEMAKAAFIFRCIGYKGLEPAESHLY